MPTPIAFLTGLLISPQAHAEQTPEPESSGSWSRDPFLAPDIGLSLFTSDGDQTELALDVGAKAGLYYDKGPWAGQFRVRGGFLVGSGSGRELRVGNFIGPKGSVLSAYTGPDVFRNHYEWDAAWLAPVTGLAWPVIAQADIRLLQVYAGVQPAWYLDEGRGSVDWSKTEQPGLGDEYTTLAGARLNLVLFSLGAHGERTLSAQGEELTVAFGLDFGF